MSLHKHKIWLTTFKAFNEEHSDKTKLIFIIAVMLISIYLFAIKISRTIEQGLETKKRTDEIAMEVAKLEKENKDLKSQKSLYQSETEIESEYRSLENKKKEGETIYIVNFGDEEDKVAEESNSDILKNSEEEYSNWDRWMRMIFR